MAPLTYPKQFERWSGGICTAYNSSELDSSSCMSPVKSVADSQQIRLSHQKFYVVIFQSKVSTLSAHARYMLQAHNFAPINHQEGE